MSIYATSNESEHNSDGVISQGFLFASVKNVGTSVAIVNGVPLSPGEAKSYPFVGKPYNEISYQTAGSVLRILVVD